MVLSGKVKKEKQAPKAKVPYKSVSCLYFGFSLLIRGRFHSTEMVLVDAGGNNGGLHTFSVHKHIICHSSAFFKAACTGQFLEAESQKVKLPDDRAELFDLFVQWLYSQNLKQIFEDVTLPIWRTLIELHILADKLQVLKLKNTILDQMLCKADEALGRGPARMPAREGFPTNVDISLAYENTPVTSPMRKFLAELFALLRDFSVEKDEVPKDYLYDLAMAMKLPWFVGGYGLPGDMKTRGRYHEQ